MLLGLTLHRPAEGHPDQDPPLSEASLGRRLQSLQENEDGVNRCPKSRPNIAAQAETDGVHTSTAAPSTCMYTWNA